ncbi:MAG: ABC transporter ATP-binding protein [Actinomycetota bacterium]|nr:MAG: ABC transporter ATP-binding protein [Actinomycetota bacterium]
MSPPALDPAAPSATESRYLLQASGLRKTFSSSGRRSSRDEGVPAVQDASIRVGHAETVAIVGESGAGKSTLGRLLIRLIEPDEGEISFEGTDLRALNGRQLRSARKHMQMVFQDPYSSLDPVMTVGQSLAEPLTIHENLSRRQTAARVTELLDHVGLPAAFADRYPRSFSGGQLQRIAIARALATRPSLIVCDEPVASLDLSIQGQILSLLVDLQEQFGLSYVFISHDLGVVRQFARRIVVMYGGRIVEEAGAQELFAQPTHPYTQALLAAIPSVVPREGARRSRGPVEPAPQTDLRAGCPYRARCPYVMPVCSTAMPPAFEIESRLSPDGGTTDPVPHHVACYLHDPARPAPQLV